MVSISNIKGSNGSGQAVRGAVTNARAISSTTLKVDSVTNYPSQFIATTGKLGPSGILDNTTVQVFFGHLSGADIIIDSFAPGYTDKGNSVADIVILKPTTAWADEVAGVLGVAHNDNGTIKNNAVKTAMLDAANIDASVALKDASVTSQKIDFTTLLLGMITPITVNQGATGGADIIGSNLTITIPAGRKVRLAWSIPLMSINVSGSRLAVFLKEGSTTILIWSQVRNYTLGSIMAGETILTGVSGTHTYKLFMVNEIGGGTVSTNADPAHPVEFYAEIVG